MGKHPWVQKLGQAKTKSAGNGAAMQQIADWLEKLGLGQYAQCFAENEIDFSILGDLTDQDLEKSAWHLSDIAANCCAPSPN